MMPENRVADKKQGEEKSARTCKRLETVAMEKKLQMLFWKTMFARAADAERAPIEKSPTPGTGQLRYIETNIVNIRYPNIYSTFRDRRRFRCHSNLPCPPVCMAYTEQGPSFHFCPCCAARSGPPNHVALPQYPETMTSFRFPGGNHCRPPKGM